MHRILVPVDGSENAARALDHALKLAKENDPIELHLVTVHPEPVMYGELLVSTYLIEKESLIGTGSAGHEGRIRRATTGSAVGAGNLFRSQDGTHVGGGERRRWHSEA